MNTDQLVSELTKSAGISEAVAKQVISMVLEYVLKQLPPALAGPVEQFLKSGGASGDAVGSIMKGLGGLFGSGESK